MQSSTPPPAISDPSQRLSPKSNPSLSSSQSPTEPPQILSAQQHIVSNNVPCDTPVPPNSLVVTPHPSFQCTSPSTPSSIPQNALQPPPTPPDSAARSSPSSNTATIGSKLSANAPQFRTRLLDAPIDIRSLSLAATSSPFPQTTSENINNGSAGNMAETSMGSAIFNEGPTPTQELFPPSSAPTISVSSPVGNSAAFDFEQSAPISLSTQSDADNMRTPNVYINGLPPNFPEEQLHAMTCEFGKVISVRTFTRHVSEKPSGYGFVLFEAVDAAEKCIETLRKFRNLHPSFSKQIHKIPGTAYASSGADSGSISLSSLPLSTSNSSTSSSLSASDSFKARMEKLADDGSTNLYMEGLPLSVDEPTLAALVSPYRIMSSRFFQTRLSNPPRIIAFVRLESRAAAEEIIERLHGRMIRGWRDAGCRISVRFADTSEQRELRRMERMNREEEHSPSRLTMAQAALLNLKGTQLRSPSASYGQALSSPDFGLSPSLGSNLTLSPDIFSGAAFPSSLPQIGHQHQQPQQRLARQDLSSLMLNSSVPLSVGGRYDGLNARASDLPGQGLRVPPHMPGFGGSGDGASSLSPEMLQLAMGVGIDGGLQAQGGMAARAQNGFTPMERMILQAHVHQQQAAQIVNQQLQRDLTSNKSKTRPLAPGRDGHCNRRLVDFLPTMSEEDFHATAGGYPLRTSELSTAKAHAGSAGSAGSLKGNIPRSSSHQTSRLMLDADSRVAFSRQRNQTHSAEARDAQAQAHMRSTTFPSSHCMNGDRTETQGLPIRNPTNASGLNSNPKPDTGRLNDNVQNVSNFNSNKNIQYATSTKNLIRGNINSNANRSNNSQQDNHLDSRTTISNNAAILPNGHIFHTTGKHTRIETSTIKSLQHEDDDDGSSLDSPELTYSARSPANFSPATPFSAFGETFEGPPMAIAVSTGDAGYGVTVGAGIGIGIGPSAVKQKAHGGGQ